MTNKTERTRALNDALRTAGVGGTILVTRSILTLTVNEQVAIHRAIREFTDFNPDNDPHGEHDCALLNAASQRVLFKIDYYDTSLTYASDDPSDPSMTSRVLTIMLASDY